MQSKLYLILILLFSCHFKRGPEKEIKVFESNLFLRLAPTYRVKIINQEYLDFKNPIIRPFFTTQPIIEFETVGENGNFKGIFCLIYRIPSAKGEGGWLKLTPLPCGIKEDESLLKLSGIKNLFLGLSPTSIDSIKKGEKIKPFHLALSFEKNKKNYLLEIPLLNLTKDDIFLRGSKKLRTTSISSARFSNGINPSYVPGTTFFPSWDGGKIKVEMMGEASDNYLDGTSKNCHRVNEKCESEEEFICDRCRYGWYEVVPTKCPNSGDKFCGVDRCGEKGYPACFRGYKFDKYQVFSGCNPENNSAFCQKGLSVICDSKGILICD